MLPIDRRFDRRFLRARAAACAAALAALSLGFAPAAHAARHSCFIEQVLQAPDGLRLYLSFQAGSQLIVNREGADAPAAIYHADGGRLLRTDTDEAQPREFLLLGQGDRLSMVHGPHDLCTVTLADHNGRPGVLAVTLFTPPGQPRVYQEEFIPSAPAR